MRFSSSKLSWSGVGLEQHVAHAGERVETTIGHFILSLYLDQNTTRCDRLGFRAGSVPGFIHPRTLMLHPPGVLPSVCTYTPSNLLVCALDKTLFDEAREEIYAEGNIALSDAMTQKQLTFFDPALRQILFLLTKEIKMGGPSGLFFVEHLVHALIARLFANNVKTAEKRNVTADRLPSKILRRLLDRMQADPMNSFDVTALAAETGYSKRHFLRIFRASTGLSPYQCLIRLRLERAKQLMHKRSLSLLDIAIESGFTSNAHLTNAFRQHVGVTPSSFRRSL
jgi:AraC family transcriptional regulator